MLPCISFCCVTSFKIFYYLELQKNVKTMKKGLISIVICALFIIFVHFHISIVISKSDYHAQQYKQPKPIVPRYKNPNQIWISMGLCYDKTTHLYNKKNYPYAEVTPMAIKLWKYWRPDVKIYIKLIHTKGEEYAPLREKYNEVLQGHPYQKLFQNFVFNILNQLLS